MLWYYLRDSINYFKTGDPKENNKNYWMFSYDFKKDKKDYEIYQNKDYELIKKKKRTRNHLIFLLYVDTIVLFVLGNGLVVKIMQFITN